MKYPAITKLTVEPILCCGLFANQTAIIQQHIVQQYISFFNDTLQPLDMLHKLLIKVYYVHLISHIQWFRSVVILQ